MLTQLLKLFPRCPSSRVDLLTSQDILTKVAFGTERGPFGVCSSAPSATHAGSWGPAWEGTALKDDLPAYKWRVQGQNRALFLGGLPAAHNTVMFPTLEK